MNILRAFVTHVDLPKGKSAPFTKAKVNCIAALCNFWLKLSVEPTLPQKEERKSEEGSKPTELDKLLGRGDVLPDLYRIDTTMDHRGADYTWESDHGAEAKFFFELDHAMGVDEQRKAVSVKNHCTFAWITWVFSIVLWVVCLSKWNLNGSDQLFGNLEVESDHGPDAKLCLLRHNMQVDQPRSAVSFNNRAACVEFLVSGCECFVCHTIRTSIDPWGATYVRNRTMVQKWTSMHACSGYSCRWTTNSVWSLCGFSYHDYWMHEPLLR